MDDRTIEALHEAAQLDLEATPLSALVVGPDEVLILKAEEQLTLEEIQDVNKVLERCGLKDRSMIISGRVELAKVARTEVPS